jgi:hypothetical protein
MSEKRIDQLPDELQPCGHMVNLISQRSDDSLKGPARWYTDFHVMTCPSCRVALKGLRELHQHVEGLAAQPPAENLKLKDESWQEIDQAIAAEN